MRNTKYTTFEYIEQIKHRCILPIDEYISAHHKINHLCLNCKHKWLVAPGTIKNGHGCPNCYQMSVRKPIEQVIKELADLNWQLSDETVYKNSYKRLKLIHKCGTEVESNLDRILRGAKRCLQCEPSPIRKKWSTPATMLHRSYSSKLELECCEYLIHLFSEKDVILQKPYSLTSKQTCDAYIKSIDTYVEVSSINKPFYLERIFSKRKKVMNFVFVSSLDQLKLFFS